MSQCAILWKNVYFMPYFLRFLKSRNYFKIKEKYLRQYFISFGNISCCTWSKSRVFRALKEKTQKFHMWSNKFSVFFIFARIVFQYLSQIDFCDTSIIGITSGSLYNFNVLCIVIFLVRCENFTSINFLGFKDLCQYLIKILFNKASKTTSSLF